MRDLEIGPYLRLRAAIEATINSIPDESQTSSGSALPKAYKRFRNDAVRLIPDEDIEQFLRLCPEWTQPLGGVQKPGTHARWFNEAKALLASLAGFLDGYVQETQLQINAEEYAKAKVADERGIGFG